MFSDRRVTRLVNDTLTGHTAEHVDIFSASKDQSQWSCPFCESNSVYQLPLPSVTKPKQLSEIKLLIKEHIQLHQKGIVEELVKENAFTNYEKEKEKQSQCTRQWIAGTILDRGLYQHIEYE
ncbi:hypothetical protein K501DRAFT_206499 [Backusella circina FSU 941]|nr:hypothetical protein K501DRAFT_206499 [Backusella circina FSU 941]